MALWYIRPVGAVVGDTVLGARVGVEVRPGNRAARLEVAGSVLDRGGHEGPVLAVGMSRALSSTTQPTPTSHIYLGW